MKFRILSNAPLTESVWSMWLESGESGVKAPGQFVQVQLPGFYLRRPISVCEWTPEALRLVYKVVGRGTDAMTGLPAGSCLDLLTGLGNGFDVSRCGDRPLLVGGGVGLPPMLGLARCLKEAGKPPRVIAAFNTEKEIFLTEDFAALGIEAEICTVDGSTGTKGFATDIMPRLDFDSVCACGPLPMLRAVHQAAGVPGQYSMEERMGCGFGACMGCTIHTAEGPRRVCKDGPVFDGEAIEWTAK